MTSQFPDRSYKGFTLVELMIVVAIIGILASIAIPNFKTFTTKAKQSEVKVNMAGIYTSQISYFVENDRYASDFFYDAGTCSLQPVLPWKPESQKEMRYTYDMGGNCLHGLVPPRLGVTPQGAFLPPGGGPSGFTVVAWADIDSDPAVDTWQLTTTKSPIVVYNDAAEKN